MYSIIKQGGMQFQAESGKKINVPLVDVAVGTEIEIKDVLLFSGNNVHVGTPILDDAVVRAKVIAHEKADKVTTFKRKKRKRYRKTIGHRQQYTVIEITGMACGTEKS